MFAANSDYIIYRASFQTANGVLAGDCGPRLAVVVMLKCFKNQDQKLRKMRQTKEGDDDISMERWINGSNIEPTLAI